MTLLLAAVLATAGHAAPALRTATCTAYCDACNTPRGTNTGAYGKLKKGDIAADQKYWPAGTRIYIVGIGLCRVRDTGGTIKGRDRFDVYLGPHATCRCNKWGRRKLKYREGKP